MVAKECRLFSSLCGRVDGGLRLGWSEEVSYSKTILRKFSYKNCNTRKSFLPAEIIFPYVVQNSVNLSFLYE